MGHLLALLDVTLAHYYATAPSGEHAHANGSSSAAATYYEPDSTQVKARAQREGVNLEEVLSPLLLLLRKLAHADVGADAAAPRPIRSAIHQNLFSSSGSEPPYRQATALGHLVRLLSSTRYPRLEALSGELLLSTCGGDARQLVSEVGYGPLAGWLARSGRAGAVADLAESGGSAEGATRHPITGAPTAAAAASSSSSSNDTANDEMTEEEKEREAERLFDLFDRLNKTGVVSVAHPVRDAQENSRFEEVNGGEESEKKEEEEAMREFVQYKERKAAKGAAATTAATASQIPHGQQ